jgi:hypothetical protein
MIGVSREEEAGCGTASQNRKIDSYGNGVIVDKVTARLLINTHLVTPCGDASQRRRRSPACMRPTTASARR